MSVVGGAARLAQERLLVELLAAMYLMFERAVSVHEVALVDVAAQPLLVARQIVVPLTAMCV